MTPRLEARIARQAEVDTQCRHCSGGGACSAERTPIAKPRIPSLTSSTGRGTGPFNPASVSVFAKLSSSLSSPKVTDWIEPPARSAAAMATPPWQ
jgi:hypothetical protein